MSAQNESREVEVYWVAGLCLGVAAIGLAARLTSKAMVRKSLQIDDYLLIWAFVLSVSQTIAHVWSAKYAGLGHHHASLPPKKISDYEKVFYVASITQPIVLGSAKMSVLILLHRVFITKTFRVAAKIMMFIVIGWFISVSVAGALICLPVKSNWNPKVPGHCGNRYVLDILDPLPWIITDFAILILPLPMVWKLHTSTRHKAALTGLFLVGAWTCIVSCIRYSHAFFSLEDPTWDTVGLINWTHVEANVTILCACLFACKPVVMFLMPDKLISKIQSYHARSSHRQRTNSHKKSNTPNKGSFRNRSSEAAGRDHEVPRILHPLSDGKQRDTLDSLELGSMRSLLDSQPAVIRDGGHIATSDSHLQGYAV